MDHPHFLLCQWSQSLALGGPQDLGQHNFIAALRRSVPFCCADARAIGLGAALGASLGLGASQNGAARLLSVVTATCLLQAVSCMQM